MSECLPACAYVVHSVPRVGRIRHALTCPNHPVIEYDRRSLYVEIPLEAVMPRRYATGARRDVVAYWWRQGASPRWLAEKLHCSVATINGDIQHLRVQGLLGKRARQPVTLESLRAERLSS